MTATRRSTSRRTKRWPARVGNTTKCRASRSPARGRATTAATGRARRTRDSVPVRTSSTARSGAGTSGRTRRGPSGCCSARIRSPIVRCSPVRTACRSGCIWSCEPRPERSWIRQRNRGCSRSFAHGSRLGGPSWTGRGHGFRSPSKDGSGSTSWSQCWQIPEVATRFRLMASRT